MLGGPPITGSASYDVGVAVALAADGRTVTVGAPVSIGPILDKSVSIDGRKVARTNLGCRSA
jgi:hypothetical protein